MAPASVIIPYRFPLCHFNSEHLLATSSSFGYKYSSTTLYHLFGSSLAAAIQHFRTVLVLNSHLSRSAYLPFPAAHSTNPPTSPTFPRYYLTPEWSANVLCIIDLDGISSNTITNHPNSVVRSSAHNQYTLLET